MDDLEFFSGVVVWLYPDENKGGCLAATDGATYLFTPKRTLNSQIRVYQNDWTPETGELVRFTIEFADDGRFGRNDYRITNLAPLADADCHPDDQAKLQQIFDDSQWSQETKRNEFGYRAGRAMYGS